MKKIIIITKSIGIEGPSRGAVCIANAISNNSEVTLISLSNDKSCVEDLNKNVEIIIYDKLINRIKLYFDINYGKLSNANGYNKILSLTFSADIFSICFINSKQKIISIRGDLFQNYEDTYGKIGRYIAWIHYSLACKANTIVCLSHTMKKQINDIFPKAKLKVIENFIDEVKYVYQLNCKKKNKINRFVFVGQLTNRKNIFELIKIFKKLIFEGEAVFLDIIGDGPVKNKILDYIEANKLEKNIYLFGAMKNPEIHLRRCDVFILPSYSEGISRAILESLYFRKPVIARNIPQNKEVIKKGKNGWLFNDYQELYSIIKKVAKLNPNKNIFNSKTSLIPPRFQHKNVRQKWLKILEIVK